MRTVSRLVRIKIVGMVVVVALLAGLVGAGQASAAQPWWHLTSVAIPSNLPPGGEGAVWIEAVNIGDAAINMPETPITVGDVLPPGLTATSIRGLTGGGEFTVLTTDAECTLATLSCVFKAPHIYEGPGSEPARAVLLSPYSSAGVEIRVKVAGSAKTGENTVMASGGGIAPASAQQPLAVSGSSVPYGVERYEFTPQEEGGGLDYQAGSHPFQLTTTLALNKTTAVDAETNFPLVAPVALAKDLQFVLPEGLAGNPTPIPQCSTEQFTTKIGGREASHYNECPQDSAIGVASVTVREALLSDTPVRFTAPLFNLTPSVGEPARLGFIVDETPVILDTSVRTGGGYNVVVNVNDISQIVSFLGSEVTFWGVPGDSRHNDARSWWCLEESNKYGTCTAEHERNPSPFLVLPTSCTGALATSISSDSWKEPGRFTTPLEPSFLQGMDGCNRLASTLRSGCAGRAAGEHPNRVDRGRTCPAGQRA